MFKKEYIYGIKFYIMNIKTYKFINFNALLVNNLKKKD